MLVINFVVDTCKVLLIHLDISCLRRYHFIRTFTRWADDRLYMLKFEEYLLMFLW